MIEYTPSCGNVFKDLNLDNPEDRLKKAMEVIKSSEKTDSRFMCLEELKSTNLRLIETKRGTST